MFAITRTRSPLADLQVASQQLNRLLDDTFRPWNWNGSTTESPLAGNWMPPVDVMEDKDQVRIEADLPGVKPEHVTISLENNVLTIRGERHQRTEEQNERVHRFERNYGLFERAFTIPGTVDAERISARYDNGVLTISLPKVERAKPRQITVQVQA